MINMNFLPLVEQFGPVVSGPGAARVAEAASLKRLSQAEREAVARAKKFAMEQNIRTVLLKQTKQHEAQQMTNVKRTQAMVLLSRIYVGSINYDVREETVRQAFSCFGTVKSVTLSYDPITQKHMGYAFIEFEYPEAAQLALAQNTGVSISGRQAKVGRPSNMPHSGPLVDDLFAEAVKYNRIYVGNVHANLNSEDLRSVFEAFGEIIYCQLQLDLTKPGKHRGFGFIEYKTQQSTIEAIGAMNLFDLGGQLLRVSKAITPPNLILPGTTVGTTMPAAAAVAAASITAQVQALEVEKVANVKPEPVLNLVTKEKPNKFSSTKITNMVQPPSLAIPEAVLLNKFSEKGSTNNITEYKEWDDNDQDLKPDSLENDNVKIRGREARNQMMQRLLRPTLQRVMILRNMIDQNEIDDQIEEEVFEECSKFGAVQEVKIVVESADNENNGDVKIFIVFVSPSSIEEAISSMNGRYFGGRVVVAERYEQELFDVGDYSA